MSGDELIEYSNRLDSLHAQFEEKHATILKKLMDAAIGVSKSWSGSNLGYHAKVYYKDLKPIPAGARFSRQNGLKDNWPLEGSVGDWEEYDSDQLISHIYRQVDDSKLRSARSDSMQLNTQFEKIKSNIISILTVALDEEQDVFLAKLKSTIEECIPRDAQYFQHAMEPRGQVISSEMDAIAEGFRIAPHQYVIADIAAINHSSVEAEKISKLANQAGSHLVRKKRQIRRSSLVGTNVFIGHGRDKSWLLLKDFVRDRLGLPYDEFNRVPVAGFTNIARLQEMLENASIALLVLTAEDEHADGKLNARMNVIHEVGLFQGRLGFSKAIVVLEDGCEEFSNIAGLGQIRFAKGHIEGAFEDVRRVMEREGLVSE